eukprot:1006076-Rhodomonas_salina.2
MQNVNRPGSDPESLDPRSLGCDSCDSERAAAAPSRAFQTCPECRVKTRTSRLANSTTTTTPTTTTTVRKKIGGMACLGCQLQVGFCARGRGGAALEGGEVLVCHSPYVRNRKRKGPRTLNPKS